jgi:putative hydrolase of the HAD superfamily
MPSGRTPQAVIFDFGGVLCFHPGDERFSPIARIFQLPVPGLISLFWANRVDYDAARLNAESYWASIAAATGQKLDPAVLPKLIRSEVELWNNYDQRVLRWAACLRTRGYRTAILSNLPRVLGEELRATPGFLDHFDHVTFSYELGFVKPEPEIYDDAIHGLGIDPAEALFLDDRPENVKGAQAVGLLAEVFSTWENFLEDGLQRYSLPAPHPAGKA